MIWEDFDIINKIFKNELDGSQNMVGARLFQQFEIFDFQTQTKAILFANDLFLVFIKILMGSPKIKINGLGKKGPIQKSRNHEHQGFGFLL